MVSKIVLGFMALVAVLGSSNAYLTDDQKEEILNAQNFYRSRVSPIATNMAKLVSNNIKLSLPIFNEFKFAFSIIQFLCITEFQQTFCCCFSSILTCLNVMPM